MIRLENLTKRFDEKVVVDSLDLDLDDGKTFTLIGPSGCGKSTLLRMLIGLISPDEGRVWIDDQPLDEVDLSSIRAEFGYVIQTGGLFPHLSARQNVALPAQFRKWTSERIAERIESLRKLTQLPNDLLDRYPAQLSGGQRQRISLIRALVLDPRFLLLDEPLGALDPMIRNELQNQLKEIFQSLGKTVILVTHDLNEAAFFADEILLMRGGRLIQRGTADSLISSPNSDFVRRFVAAQQSHMLAKGGSK